MASTPRIIYADRRRQIPEWEHKPILLFIVPERAEGVKALRNTSDARRQAAKFC
jgi:hypothetical protein